MSRAQYPQQQLRCPGCLVCGKSRLEPKLCTVRATDCITLNNTLVLSLGVASLDTQTMHCLSHRLNGHSNTGYEEIFGRQEPEIPSPYQ